MGTGRKLLPGSRQPRRKASMKEACLSNRNPMRVPSYTKCKPCKLTCERNYSSIIYLQCHQSKYTSITKSYHLIPNQ